jgi:hypothetical protein
MDPLSTRRTRGGRRKDGKIGCAANAIGRKTSFNPGVSAKSLFYPRNNELNTQKEEEKEDEKENEREKAAAMAKAGGKKKTPVHPIGWKN